MEGCPCPACALGLTRGYLRYLAHARELTGMRLLTLHNLAFVARLDGRLREAIGAGTLAAEARGAARGRGAVVPSARAAALRGVCCITEGREPLTAWPRDRPCERLRAMAAGVGLADAAPASPTSAARQGTARPDHRRPPR